jgi:hypothetical protein
MEQRVSRVHRVTKVHQVQPDRKDHRANRVTPEQLAVQAVREKVANQAKPARQVTQEHQALLACR